jgi:hypothetical protein
VPVTAGRDQGAGTLQAMHDANGVLPHLLDHDGGRLTGIDMEERFMNTREGQLGSFVKAVAAFAADKHRNPERSKAKFVGPSRSRCAHADSVAE